MRDKESGRPGRPRSFDVERALVVGERLFHERGFDGVSLSDLTYALNIAAPSFYAAFGSKADFFQQILNRYNASALSIDELIVEQDPIAAIEKFLIARAVSYSEDNAAKGCLILDATRNCSDADAANTATKLAEGGRGRVRELVAISRPDMAEQVSDLVACVMQGLSAYARQGWSTERLVAVAKSAALAVRVIAERSNPVEEIATSQNST
ncbi:TetR/AcrR family transcriptional regulator [Rhizobium sp. TRM95796]|uniref:TetR/AcrR family transcriptional regulator n=1 Tax=Rhizobium sp. TRM95796 TaxID=2979862 RepID=UPI0021E77ED6|nr:TetR/AcrR family transcriptional regulator [Rhizobium sp. TRM95796]MCV3768844.1 TetR/AcrR family transcriptional regulator [Rhizobium sp. TRM95796]